MPHRSCRRDGVVVRRLDFNGAGEIGVADRPVVGIRCAIAGATKRVDGSATGHVRFPSGAPGAARSTCIAASIETDANVIRNDDDR
jgi:hypothetical protein